MPSQNEARQNLLTIYQSALQAVAGAARVRDYLLENKITGPCYVIAIGKAACAMTSGAREVLDQQIVDALIISKPGYIQELPWPVLEAGHPVPDEKSLFAGKQLLAFIADIPESAAVLFLLSGGASALVEVLAPGLTLQDLQTVNSWLLGSGLDIKACNTVRKNMSQIKQGRLAKLLAPRRVTNLVISDVADDDLSVIGSGLLIAENENADLQQSILSSLPVEISNKLKTNVSAPGAGDVCFCNVDTKVIANNGLALRAASACAEKLGYRVKLSDQYLENESHETGRKLARKVINAKNNELFIWGGETYVKLPGKTGRGGRCQAMALSAARELTGHDNILLLCAATDGSDGPGTDAGALVDGGTLTRGHETGLDENKYLERADAGSFLEVCGDLISTGATGTNVADIVLGLKL
ncbi:MAG: glycerate kinase [Acidiferrobacterales bacterium]